MTTVHAYTNDQNLLDLTAQGPAPGPGGAVNIVPASPARPGPPASCSRPMKGRLDGTSLRVPVPAGSITDFTAVVQGNPSAAEVNAAFAEAAAKPPLDRVLDYTEDPIVSSDIVGSPASCTFDAGLTMVMPIGDELVPGEGVRLVRQRVGLLEPPGRPGRAGRRGLTAMDPTARPPAPGGPPADDCRRRSGVLVRVDFNVPLHIGVRGRATVADDFRITAALPTLHWLLRTGAPRWSAASHLGRPAGAPRPALGDGPGARAAARRCAPGVGAHREPALRPGREGNDPAFVQRLIDGFDAYVNEAFGVAHRADASIVGPPAVPAQRGAGCASPGRSRCSAGSSSSPARPFVAVVGGAKVADKLGVLKVLATKVDTLVVGGGMAFTFLAALGHHVGASLLDADAPRRLPGACSRPGVRHPAADRHPRARAGRARFGPAAGGASGPAGERQGDRGRSARRLDRPRHRPRRPRRRFADVGAPAPAPCCGTGRWARSRTARFAAGTRVVAEAVADCAGLHRRGRRRQRQRARRARPGRARSTSSRPAAAPRSRFIESEGHLPGIDALRRAPNAPPGQRRQAGHRPPPAGQRELEDAPRPHRGAAHRARPRSAAEARGRGPRRRLGPPALHRPAHRADAGREGAHPGRPGRPALLGRGRRGPHRRGEPALAGPPRRRPT